MGRELIFTMEGFEIISVIRNQLFSELLQIIFAVNIQNPKSNLHDVVFSHVSLHPDDELDINRNGNTL